jgi:hypothetical protein
MEWLKDGPGWSPDVGAYWKRRNKIYFEDGEVMDVDVDEGVFRTMDMECEDFSQWSEEKRQSVRAEWAEKRRLHKKEYDAEQKRIESLRISARTKLTPEEAEACGL